MPKTQQKQQTVPAGPLFKRIEAKRGGKAAFAKQLDIDHGRLSNWKKRGIPWAQVTRVAAAIGMAREEYLAEAGLSQKIARQPRGQYTIEASTLLEDFNALPDWLQEHIARKTAELRKMSDSLAPMVRDGMKGPPKDPARYREWERGIEDLMNAQIAKPEKERK